MRNKSAKLLATAFLLAGTVTTSNIEVQAAQWNMDNNGWWYQEDDGSYSTNTWKSINGKWYYFNENGYILTGWQEISGEWYYFNSEGAMVSNTWVGNYYLTASGTMATNTWIGDYYVGADGQWKTAQWNEDNNGWWYCHADGSYITNSWEFINGDWYYFNANGYMLTGWQEISGQWYYLNADGTMATNVWIGDYYLTGSGAMAVNTWIGEYYVDANGTWVPNKIKGNWTKYGNRWKYYHSDGSYTRNDWEEIDGYWYLFDSNGWMLTGWQYANENWYYLQGNGAMLDQGWHEISGDWYYMYSGGAMAVNTWIGEYYVNSSGVRVDVSNGIYLLDVVKPYKTPRYYTEYVSRSFSMGGNDYTNGFTSYRGGNEGEIIYFNLGGKYKKLSFIAGIVDGYDPRNETKISIIVDGKEVANFKLNNGDLPISCEAAIDNCKQLKIAIQGPVGSGLYGLFGIAELKLQ